VTLVWSGLSVGAIYALVAITFNVVYTSVGVFNFAQGAILTLGVYVAYFGVVTASLPAPLVAALAMVVCAVTGLLEARFVLLPKALGRNELLTTVGAATAIAGAVSLIWGNDVRRVPASVSKRVLVVLGGRVLPNQLWTIGLAVLLSMAIASWYRYTRAGLASLAVAEDREAARLRGIDVTRKSYEAFIVAGAIAGLAGLFVGPETFAFPELGSSLVLIAFVSFVLGGSGSVTGGVLGGFALGLVQQFTARYLGVLYTNSVIFGLLLAVLIALPSGVFGDRRTRTI